MTSDEKFVRTTEEVYAEISFILEHGDSNNDLIGRAWRLVSPKPYSLALVTTLASEDVERFLFALRRAVLHNVTAEFNRYVAVPR